MFSVFQFGAGRCLIFWKRAFRCNERVLLSGGGLTSVVCRFRVFNTLSRAWFHIGAVPKREKTTTSWQCTLTQQRLCFWTHENQFYHCCGTLWPLEKVTHFQWRNQYERNAQGSLASAGGLETEKLFGLARIQNNTV